MNRSISDKIIISFVSRFYYLKYYTPFIFSHKPLCEKFKNDTIVIFNKIYLCKSCFYFYLGILSSFLLINISLNLNYLFCVLFLIIICSYPRFYANNKRFVRNLLRFFLGFFSMLLMLDLIKIDILYFVMYLIICIILKNFYNKKRSKIDICSNCTAKNGRKAC